MKTKGSGTDFSNYVDSQCCDKECSMNDDPNVNGRDIVPPPAPVSSSGTGKIKTVHTAKSKPTMNPYYQGQAKKHKLGGGSYTPPTDFQQGGGSPISASQNYEGMKSGTGANTSPFPAATHRKSTSVGGSKKVKLR